MEVRKTPNARLPRLNREEFRRSEKTPVFIVLDNVRSLNNIGSVFRTADAFRLQGIYLCGISAKPPHRDIEKTALGATESVQWEYFERTEDAVQKLHGLGILICAVEQTSHSVALQDFQPPPGKPLALIFGHEIQGVHDSVLALCDAWIEIPQTGTKHSLNIAVSVGIVVWDLACKLKVL